MLKIFFYKLHICLTLLKNVRIYIYIEIRNYLDIELQITIDAKKIILKLSVPLEDKEWKKLKNMN